MKEESSKLTLSILKLSEAKGTRIDKIQPRKLYMCEKVLILYTNDNLDNASPFFSSPPQKLNCRSGHKPGKRLQSNLKIINKSVKSLFSYTTKQI